MFSVLAFAVTEYNNSSARFYIPKEFTRDTQWAEKYCFEDYWYSENYGIEVVLITDSYYESTFYQKHLDEPHYLCHNFSKNTYAVTTGMGSENVTTANGVEGTLYKQKMEYDGNTLMQYEYRFNTKQGKTLIMIFYVHDEKDDMYREMIMDTFEITPLSYFLQHANTIRTLVAFLITCLIFAGIDRYRRKRK